MINLESLITEMFSSSISPSAIEHIRKQINNDLSNYSVDTIRDDIRKWNDAVSYRIECVRNNLEIPGNIADINHIFDIYKKLKF